jgi:hypothetical protein
MPSPSRNRWIRDVQVSRDLLVGESFQEAREDLLAFGGVGVFLGAVGFAFGELEPGGFGDFVAVQETAREVGDQVVPGVSGGAVEVADVVAVFAGEAGGSWWSWTGSASLGSPSHLGMVRGGRG